jgi:plastocyanin
MIQETAMNARLLVILCTLMVISGRADAEQYAIGQKGRLFKPGSMRVKAGDTVVFKNDDTVVHHVYSSTKGHEFDLETTNPGEDVKRTFPSKGRVDVRCGLHPGMRLVVTVE